MNPLDADQNVEQRQTLASGWNRIINAGCRITLRQFAAKHGLRYETWRREYHRGAMGIAIDAPKDRRYVIELLAHVTQHDVVAALKRMVARKAVANAISITTDNGCEFLDPDKIKSVVGCSVYYTRAYASWEKGSVENCNKLVRRWYPKGTDFAKCTTAQMHHLERVINSIHRKLLDGKTAYEYDTAYNKAAS